MLEESNKNDHFYFCYYTTWLYYKYIYYKAILLFLFLTQYIVTIFHVLVKIKMLKIFLL